MCTPPVVNQIACENPLQGQDAAIWEVPAAGDPTIQGFATAMSRNKGETVGLKIRSSTPNYQIDILRLGYHGGDGARVIASGLTPTNTTSQPECETFDEVGLIDGGNWAISRSWSVPLTAVSGVYI